MEACTKQGLSALVVAIKIGHLDETKLLVAGGADINHPTAETGMTPLMTAALYVVWDNSPSSMAAPVIRLVVACLTVLALSVLIDGSPFAFCLN